jgi:hypothetical protein
MAVAAVRHKFAVLYSPVGRADLIPFVEAARHINHLCRQGIKAKYQQ